MTHCSRKKLTNRITNILWPKLINYEWTRHFSIIIIISYQTKRSLKCIHPLLIYHIFSLSTRYVIWLAVFTKTRTQTVADIKILFILRNTLRLIHCLFSNILWLINCLWYYYNWAKLLFDIWHIRTYLNTIDLHCLWAK